MTTTIQINERTLQLLKKLKEETCSNSYEEAIIKTVLNKNKEESFAGVLKEHISKKNAEKLIKELQNERRKSDRF